MGQEPLNVLLWGFYVGFVFSYVNFRHVNRLVVSMSEEVEGEVE